MFGTLHMGTLIPGSLPQEENKIMNKHRSKISVPENKTFTYLGVSAFYLL